MKRLTKWIVGSGLRPFPVLDTLRSYTWGKAKADARASVNVALLDFPQGMAYALIAGLPVQFGIFCSSLASLVGPLFASSRFVMLGPTNATAVMLLSAFLTLGYSPVEAAAVLPLLLVLVGVFMVAGAFLRVSVITQYISRSVVVGYITAAACLIIVNQLKTALGMQVPRAGTFAESLAHLVRGLGTVQWDAAIVSVLTLGVYFLLRRLARGLPTVAVTLVLVAAATVGFGHWWGVEVEMLDGVRLDGWPLSVPKWNWADFYDLTNAALAVAFLSLLESSAISKTLAAQAGDRVDLNQQMLSMGMASFCCAFGSGMAVSGSLTRSMLNYRSGAKTCVSSMMSGALLVAALLLFGGLIRYIPRASLAVLVIMVGVSLIHVPTIRVVLETTRSDATVFLSTLVGGVFLPLDTAIYLGAAVSIGLFVRKAARPGLKEIAFDEKGELVEGGAPRERPEITIVHVEGDLFFASTDVFLEQMRHLAQHPNQYAIILRMRNAHHLDATIALALMDLIRYARANGCEILVSGAHEAVEMVFRRSGLMDLLGSDNFFRYHEGNPNVSTRNALKRAQELTGLQSADITIFAAEKEK